MEHEVDRNQLSRELESLRTEVAELRAVEAMHLQTREGLEAIELQLAGIIHSAMDAIITVNETQQIVLFNEAAEHMFGCVTNDAIGQPIDRFIPERFRASHQDHIRKFGQTAVTNRRMGALGIIYGLRTNGEEFPLEASISQVKTGEKRLYTVILRDITERKRAEEREAHFTRQLRQTEQLAELGTLASGMAHEIGTPMNVILGRAEFLMRKTGEDMTKKGLGTILSQVERITKIMNQLLSFARRRPIERRPLDLSVVVREILDVVQERMERRRIQLITEVPPDVPLVLADRDQMGQVVLNLVINAIQVMPHGGTLRVSLKATDNGVTLVVADTGCGIPQENIPKLFTPFFTTKEVGEGTGLGLTVVHGIIQEHEGSIVVDSVPKKGTTFSITLPRHLPQQPST